MRAGFVLTAGIFLIGSGDRSRSMTAKAQIAMLEAALEAFRIDNGRYPTTDEGLAALVEIPPGLLMSSAYLAGGYLREHRVPDDPWGHVFLYRIPGQHNTEGFDLWSLGADGAPGGEGIDAGVGNWQGGFAEHEEWHWREALLHSLWFGILVGGALGAPIYLFGLISAALGRRSWRSALIGAPFATLVYLVVACTLAYLIFPATIE